jgi:hypothetical protein
MATAHFDQGGVALRRCGVPVQPVPLGTEKLAERVTDREAHTDAVGPELLDWWGTEVLRLTDSHRAKAYGGTTGSRKAEPRGPMSTRPERPRGAAITSKARVARSLVHAPAAVQSHSSARSLRHPPPPQARSR